jgi:hypothetical protein
LVAMAIGYYDRHSGEGRHRRKKVSRRRHRGTR